MGTFAWLLFFRLPTRTTVTVYNYHISVCLPMFAYKILYMFWQHLRNRNTKVKSEAEA